MQVRRETPVSSQDIELAAIPAEGQQRSTDDSPEFSEDRPVPFPFGMGAADDEASVGDGIPTAAPLRLEVINDGPSIAEYDLVRRMRAGICVLGPLLARRGRACVSLPGGCNIGDRPVDLHLKGLTALGAELRVERGYIFARAKRLRGARIYLGGAFGSTVTGTCNVMSAATLADGVTTIEAAACEPEVVDLGTYLNTLGAQITGLGTPFLRIEGVESLTGGEHTIIPDRIEAATLMIAAAMTRGDIVLENVCVEHLTAVVEKLREVGVTIESVGRMARVSVRDELKATDGIMLPYPGFPTDVQAQLMALLTIVPGISIITDKVFPDRFMHAAELARMGARIRREGPCAIVSGVAGLSGASVMASDLRASAALVLAALAAEGDSVIRRIYHIDRGYDRLEDKLNDLGASIVRTQDAPHNMPASLTVSAAEMLPADEGDHALKGPNWLNRRERLKIHHPDEIE
ncbi:MAG: UDP-N-acetylglucosamine 1-carboxyvinyltransferase [Planctomycetaceae bacterium]|nr:UDP-N-acetylglucosamine 1-carboxyvinyltransferase [Planctomycetaceae bacterium]